jgi:hypothetical protein
MPISKPKARGRARPALKTLQNNSHLDAFPPLLSTPEKKPRAKNNNKPATPVSVSPPKFRSAEAEVETASSSDVAMTLTPSKVTITVVSEDPSVASTPNRASSVLVLLLALVVLLLSAFSNTSSAATTASTPWSYAKATEAVPAMFEDTLFDRISEKGRYAKLRSGKKCLAFRNGLVMRACGMAQRFAVENGQLKVAGFLGERCYEYENGVERLDRCEVEEVEKAAFNSATGSRSSMGVDKDWLALGHF